MGRDCRRSVKILWFFSAIRIDSMNLNFNEESGPKF